MERPIAKSTLQLFRAQLLEHPQMRLAFERGLELAKKTGYVRNSKPVRLALDASNILGRGLVCNTYNLISEGIRQVVNVLARARKQNPQDYARSQGPGAPLRELDQGRERGGLEDEDSRSRFRAQLVWRRPIERCGWGARCGASWRRGTRPSSGSRPDASSWPPSCSRISRSSGRRMGARRARSQFGWRRLRDLLAVLERPAIDRSALELPRRPGSPDRRAGRPRRRRISAE
jgi:hypothetical protein